MKVYLYDDYMDINYYNYVSKIIIDNKDFPWYSNKIVSGNNVKIDEKLNHQFTNVFYNKKPLNECYELFAPLLQSLNYTKLLKAKVNMTLYNNSIVEHGYHIDMPWDSEYTETGMTAVYYLNTCDGYTKFDGGEKIQSISNRLVKFPANLLHTGTSTTNKKCRYVLNINYIQ